MRRLLSCSAYSLNLRSCNFNCVKALIVYILPHLDNTIFNRANQMRSLSLRAKLHIFADSNNNISKALLTYFAFLCFWTFQKEQIEVFHASEHFRKAKWKIFMLLNVSERPKRRFSCFWTFQKGQKLKIIASVNDISMKKRK